MGIQAQTRSLGMAMPSVQVVDNDHNANANSSSGMFSKFGFDTNDNITNSSAIDFAEATGSWGTVTHWSLWSHATETGSSYFLMSGALSSGVGVASGDQFRISSGQFDITFPNRWGVGSGTVTIAEDTSYNLYQSTTEWRRQLARRLGFINEPWGRFMAMDTIGQVLMIRVHPRKDYFSKSKPSMAEYFSSVFWLHFPICKSINRFCFNYYCF